MRNIIEFIRFLFLKKKIILIPVFLILIIFGLLLILAQGSVIAPFIYTIF